VNGRGGEAAVAAACASCGAELENPQRCRKCGAFQPPDPRRDHFATLGLPRGYAVDAALLERRVVDFGRELHPDLAGGDAATRTKAVLAAAQVNEAYSVLRDDYRRAEYLLQLAGGPTAADDKSVPGGFLEQMLEERTELEEALETGRAEGEALLRRFEEARARQRDGVASAFAGLERGADRAAALRALRAQLNVMAYYRGLARDLRERLREKE
jgi:molecular chaperone HscB